MLMSALGVFKNVALLKTSSPNHLSMLASFALHTPFKTFLNLSSKIALHSTGLLHLKAPCWLHGNAVVFNQWVYLVSQLLKR